ncbi:50S ribosomal protein L25/general stress protein Ctc [Lachnoclostridium sp. An169]|uniref:50S ribosomal protein L25 n=1 Tax=Lachnoclostridium sp. An169 TaxID=1965569 RepID=UPI000B380932|nr:50S ribosomal protein L25 [Lachnoclostridium sp. An169]OUP81546.1 50S ribosomal protein L25/general stress protein Ctc [Lachnoclostridium sp. An169]HJA68373.1 50S ribosomal protein L25 [Candidatus Mediterraneibacter cottocaccae]
MNTLKAERRDMSIKAKKLRREGFVTGCIFGREMKESIPLKMEKSAVERLLKEEGKGGQVMLEVEGQTYDALIKEVDYNPLKGQVDEIDFQALVSGEKVHSVAEIHLVNLDKLVAGVPQQMLHEVAFKALPSALVEKIELDVGDLKVGDTIRVKDLDIAKDKDVDLSTDLEATVVTITEVHASAADVGEETDEEAAAE